MSPHSYPRRPVDSGRLDPHDQSGDRNWARTTSVPIQRPTGSWSGPILAIVGAACAALFTFGAMRAAEMMPAKANAASTMVAPSGDSLPNGITAGPASTPAPQATPSDDPTPGSTTAATKKAKRKKGHGTATATASDKSADTKATDTKSTDTKATDTKTADNTPDTKSADDTTTKGKKGKKAGGNAGSGKSGDAASDQDVADAQKLLDQSKDAASL